jgi:hypothetical protein
MRMLRQASVVVILVLAAAISSATTIPLVPLQDGQGTGQYDTVGPESIYAAVSGSVTINSNNSTSIILNFNFGGTTLAPFTDPSSGVKLEVGDLLFEVGNSRFGIPIVTHLNLPGNNASSMLYAGHLYENFGDGAYLSAYQVLSGDNTLVDLNNYPYRPLQPVWLGNAAQPYPGATALTVAVSPKGAGTPEFTVTLSGALPSGFVDQIDADGMEVLFSAASCGNGVLTGNTPPQVPESSSWLMICSGLLAVASGGWRNLFSASAGQQRH